MLVQDARFAAFCGFPPKNFRYLEICEILKTFRVIELLNGMWSEVINTLSRPIESLKNQSEQLQHVNSNIVDNAEICQILCARERLTFKINTGIDDEIALIAHGVQAFHNLYQELKNKFNYLTTLKTKISEHDPLMLDLVRGTGSRPQLSLLLENDEQTIEELAFALEGNDIEQSKVMKTLVITQFFINQTTI